MTEIAGRVALERRSITRMWVLSVRGFDENNKEYRMFLDDDMDLPSLMRRARDGFGCHHWSVYLDAAHAPGELRIHVMGENGRCYMLSQSAWEP